jgi:anti-sigma regulatory factor (Ser/Thr protein kinase)
MMRGRQAATSAAPSRRTPAVGERDVLDLHVPARTDAVAAARHAVVRHLLRAGVPSVVVDDLELLTSELVTNAVIHPRPPAPTVHVRVAVAECIEVRVAHRGTAAALPPLDDWHPVPATALRGRGLGIVRRLCDDVVVAQVGDQTVVTCRRSVPAIRSDRGLTEE